MNPRGLLDARQRSHRLLAPAKTVTDAARHMLAVQSQDLSAGRWALGARTRGAVTRDAVDAAFDRGALVRAWTMRGTLHIIPARDLGWVLSVTADRQRQQAASRSRELGVDDDVMAVAARALRPALIDGGCTRAEAFELLQGVDIDPGGQRGIHLLFRLTIDGVLCQGPVVAGSAQQRFVAAETWIKDSVVPDDPLAELFVRYIDGHGPAGVRDFAWWSGLTLGSAREASERARGRVREVADDVFTALSVPRRSVDDVTAFALPAFDEYYISYDDRSAVCMPEHATSVGPGKNGMVRPVLIEHGRVVGTWSHAQAAQGAGAKLFDGQPLSAAIDAALARFARFAGAAVEG